MSPDDPTTSSNHHRRTPAVARMKVHLRLVRAGGATFRLVTPRPDLRVSFSTNYYHCTWHVLSDPRGARLLARLLWGLAYQRRPGTMVLLGEPHLRPTPFDGAPSDPVLLIPAGLTPFDPRALRRLKARLPRLGPPDQTIRWHTFGLDRELTAWRGQHEDASAVAREGEMLGQAEGEVLWKSERMSRTGGFICYTAPPAVLRQQALVLHSMHVKPGNCYTEMDYHFLAERSATGGFWADGEVQVFADYRQRVSAATAARREVLARPDPPADPETLEEVISRRRDAIRSSRRAK